LRSSDLHFYFVYGGKRNYIAHNDAGWTDYYCDVTETIPNMLRKTIKFFEYISEKMENDIYIVRTNLSTVFDMKLLVEWFAMPTIPRKNFFAGPIIGGLNGKYSSISGTCMVLTMDVVQFVLRYQDRFSFTINEDIELSALIMINLNPLLMSVKRLDFINEILYHKCAIADETIWCFRFKSDDRLDDLNTMKKLIEYFRNENGRNLTEFVHTYANGKAIKHELPDYDALSKQIFQIDDNRK
jgi:hypothetical protein